jgi:hypothetical protein
MAWLGIWFEHGAGEGGPRSPELFQALAPPIVYPFAHTFIEEEGKRLAATRDPGEMKQGGERFRVFYSLAHDGGNGALDAQGCGILKWLFENFLPEEDPPRPDGRPPRKRPSLCSRFSEVPVVVHAEDPTRAAALVNALVILRFLGAREDQAIAKVLLHPWSPFRGSPRLAALDYEKRVLDFLHGEIFYPEDVSLFDILDRNDLRSHREMEACCLSQIGFILPILDWIDECPPKSEAEKADLFGKLRKSIEDEARTYRRRKSRPQEPKRRRYEFEA